MRTTLECVGVYHGYTMSFLTKNEQLLGLLFPSQDDVAIPKWGLFVKEKSCSFLYEYDKSGDSVVDDALDHQSRVRKFDPPRPSVFLTRL